MLLQDARRPARTTPAGDLVLLEQQDRSLWKRSQVAEGLDLAAAALAAAPGYYSLQAGVAAEHGRAGSAAETDWRRIVELYDTLFALQPTPVIELNRAVAVAMDEGWEAGLRLVRAIETRGDLETYYLLWSVQAELLRRLGRSAEAERAYERALGLVTSEPERRFLARRLAEVKG